METRKSSRSIIFVPAPRGCISDNILNPRIQGIFNKVISTMLIPTDFVREKWNRSIPVSYTHLDVYKRQPLVLAYIGDCVYDLIIKSWIMSRGNRQVHKMHEDTSAYVQASAQSLMMRKMQEYLTQEEHAVYRRGRNAKSVSPAKNQSITDYRLSLIHI